MIKLKCVYFFHHYLQVPVQLKKLIEKSKLNLQKAHPPGPFIYAKALSLAATWKTKIPQAWPAGFFL